MCPYCGSNNEYCCEGLGLWVCLDCNSWIP